MLHLVGVLDSDGATYKALEYCGEALEGMSIAGRLTIDSMAVEAGAKAGLFPADEVIRRHLNRFGREDRYRSLKAEPEASCEQVVEIVACQLDQKVMEEGGLLPYIGKYGDFQINSPCPEGTLEPRKWFMVSVSYAIL